MVLAPTEGSAFNWPSEEAGGEAEPGPAAKPPDWAVDCLCPPPSQFPKVEVTTLVTMIGETLNGEHRAEEELGSPTCTTTPGQECELLRQGKLSSWTTERENKCGNDTARSASQAEAKDTVEEQWLNLPEQSWSSPAQLLSLTQLTGNVFFLSLLPPLSPRKKQLDRVYRSDTFSPTPHMFKHPPLHS
ncbi:hypothetical protein A6R68_03787 [Neotoma lepida]|uniref:Uncharacterized protein n=1 Tax=Neotoma lepida TaxID=56216 RepID=A0A1A6GN44_NEOLE|nr:hypothetical protein A6R68_03787 [Neotoma lepida]